MDEFNFTKYSQAFLEDESLGSRPFFIDQNQTYTYQDLMMHAQAKASELEQSPDVFMALQMESSYLLFVHLLAGLLAQKKFLMLSPKEPIASVSQHKSHFQFSKLLTDENSPISLREIKSTTLKAVKNMQIALCILSSGSTAPSKIISLHLNNVHASAKSFIKFFQVKENESLLLNLPHHHIGGLMVLWRAFLSGASVTIKLESPFQYISLVPLQLKRWMQDEEKLHKLSLCKAILIGGAALDSDLRSLAEVSGLKIYETYGMSETTSFVMLNGRPLPEQMVKLDSTGHFLIKGPTLSPDMPVDSEGFYHTKDLGVQDNDQFKFLRRSDLLFKSAGETIDPLAIEAEIKKLSWITNAVIVAVDHPTWTHATTLIYTTNDLTKTAEDIKEHLKAKLHPHLVPKYFLQAPSDFFIEGMKPKRFELSLWAQEQYFKTLFNVKFIEKSGSHKLLVFFHGFMEEYDDLVNLQHPEFDCSYLFIDLPGHGETSINNFSDRASIFSQLESLILFYKKNQDLLIYGYSMGGRIAIELAARIKPKLLILESAHFGIDSAEDKKERFEKDMTLLNDPNMDLKSFFKVWYSNPIFGSYNQSKNFSLEIKKKLQHSPAEWQKSLKYFSPGAAVATLQENISALKGIKIIGIVGSEDNKYLSHYQEISLKNLDFKFITLEGAAHNPHKTHVKEIKAILAELV